MALKGTLETFHLASLLQLFSSEQKTGVLQLTKGPDEIHIFFKDGVIVYASSADKDLRLGRLLVGKGLLSEPHLRACLDEAQEKRVKLGAVLVKRGHISAKTLAEMLRYQVKELLYSLFFWGNGDFQFRDMPLDVEGKLVTRMNTMEVVLEASRRIDEWSVIRRHIPNNEMIFQLSEGSQDKNEVKLNKEEWGILKFIDGRKTVADLAEKRGGNEFTFYKGLCSLMLSGLIEPVEHLPGREREDGIAFSTVVTIYDDVFKIILEDLQAQLGNRAVEIFHGCKAQLLPEQQPFFEGYLPTPGQKTAQAGTPEMEAHGQTEKGRAMLIHCLNSLLQFFMSKELDTLGTALTRETIERIHQTLAHVREYQKTSEETQEIVNRIGSILSEVGDRLSGDKAKSGGIFSFVRKRGASE